MKQFTLAIIVDVHGWAWDIASRELLANSKRIKGEIFTVAEVPDNKDRLKDFDLILFYPFAHTIVRNILKNFPHKVIIGIAGGNMVDSFWLDTFRKLCWEFPMLGANNPIIQSLYSLHFPDKQVLLLSHGVETDIFKPKKIKRSKKFTVGFVGRTVMPGKRFKFAKEIVDSIKGAELKVADFYDDGNYEYVEHDQMPEFYNSLDCLLVTSIFEAHPMVVYEALSCGIPVVTTRVGDLNDTVINGVNSFIVEVNAPQKSFVERIELLKASPKLRKTMAMAARQTILQRWSWKNVVPQYEHLGGLLE